MGTVSTIVRRLCSSIRPFSDTFSFNITIPRRHRSTSVTKGKNCGGQRQPAATESLVELELFLNGGFSSSQTSKLVGIISITIHDSGLVLSHKLTPV